MVFRSENELIEALSTAVIVVDSSLRVQRANAAALALIESGQTRVQGALLSSILPGADELVAAAKRALLESRPFTERGMALRLSKSGSAAVDCAITPHWNGGDKPKCLLIEMSNVERHQRIRLEGSIVKQNNASIALLQGLAHEIKNPLGGIRGAAQLLERELEDQKQAEYTQVIISEADRLRALVERMLGPRGGSRQEPLNIHDVTEHVLKVVEAETHSAALIKRDYDPSLPMFLGDRDQLIQVFLNLLRNAVEAVDPVAGEIVVTTRIQRKFTIGTRIHRQVIKTEVSDNGPGIDPDLGSAVFLPLVSGRAEGSGLGLSIAQSLVYRQGGLLGFESEPGRTCFSVWLPVGEQK